MPTDIFVNGSMFLLFTDMLLLSDKRRLNIEETLFVGTSIIKESR